MRTTLTLDDDVAAALERLRKKRESSYRDIVNDVLRQGLQRINQAREPTARYVQRTHDAGKCLLPNIDNVWEVISQVEGEDFR